MKNGKQALGNGTETSNSFEHFWEKSLETDAEEGGFGSGMLLGEGEGPISATPKATAHDSFLEMLKTIEQRYAKLPKAVRIRVERWISKLAYHVDNPTWIRERNMSYP